MTAAAQAATPNVRRWRCPNVAVRQSAIVASEGGTALPATPHVLGNGADVANLTFARFSDARIAARNVNQRGIS
jgi:hypothetical protein